MRANGTVGTADCRTAGDSGADKQRFVGAGGMMNCTNL